MFSVTDLSHLIVFSGDRFLPFNKARLCIMDRAFFYGDGLCETMRAYGGRILKLQDHLDRLLLAADFQSLDLFYTREEFEDILYQLLRRNSLREACIRITIRNHEAASDGSRETRTIAMALPFEENMDSLRESGIELSTIRIVKGNPGSNDVGRLPPFLESLFAFLGRPNGKIREGLLLDGGNIVSDGDVSNIFGIRRGKIITPALEPGVFPEVLRQTILEIARDTGINARETTVTLRELLRMEEIFLVSARYEVLPVVRLEGHIIGDGTPGGVTRDIQKTFQRLISESA